MVDGKINNNPKFKKQGKVAGKVYLRLGEVLPSPLPSPNYIVMAIIPNGCILVARKVMESEIWSKPSWWYKIFSYIIMEVSYKTEGINARGTSFFQYKTIFKECNLDKEKTWKGRISPKSIDNVVRWMREVGICTTTKTTRGIWITLCKYELYQNINNYKTTTKTPIKRHKNDTISKEGKKVKNVERELFKPPTLQTIKDYIKEKKYAVDANTFYDYFKESDWIDSKGNKVKSWKQKLITWNSHSDKGKNGGGKWQTSL